MPLVKSGDERVKRFLLKNFHGVFNAFSRSRRGWLEYLLGLIDGPMGLMFKPMGRIPSKLQFITHPVDRSNDLPVRRYLFHFLAQILDMTVDGSVADHPVILIDLVQ